MIVEVSVGVWVVCVFMVDHVVDGVWMWDRIVFSWRDGWWLVVPEWHTVAGEECFDGFPFVVERVGAVFDEFSVVAVSDPLF